MWRAIIFSQSTIEYSPPPHVLFPPAYTHTTHTHARNMSVLYYLVSFFKTPEGTVVFVGRIDFFHLGLGAEYEEFSTSGLDATPNKDFATSSSYRAFLAWVNSITPEGLQWELISEYVDEQIPKGITQVGELEFVRNKAIDLRFTTREWIDSNDAIRRAVGVNLFGEQIPRDPRPAPAYPRLAVTESGMFCLDHGTALEKEIAEAKVEYAVFDLSQVPVISIHHPVLTLDGL